MTDPPTCLNCDAPVEGQFCSQCGQSMREPRGPFAGLVSDFFGTVFNFDSRFLSSMFILLTRPGQLTESFLEGKRASVLPPVRMYLVLSLLLFLIVRVPVGDASKTNLYVGGQLVGRDAPDPELGKSELGLTSDARTWPWIASALEAKEEKWRRMDPQRLLDAISKGIEGNLAKALILFIPLLALVLKILYLFKKRFYYDHVIFALHYQSFLFLLGLVCRCLSWITPWVYLALLYSPLYLGWAMRRVYGQSWPWTLIKLAVLLASYFFALSLVLALTITYVLARI